MQCFISGKASRWPIRAVKTKPIKSSMSEAINGAINVGELFLGRS